MTIKEAIDGCNWLKKYDYHADTKEVMDMAINALEDQEKHRWIPVSERLPNKDGDYLVTEKLFTKSCVTIFSFSTDLKSLDELDYGVKGFYIFDTEFGYHNCNDIVAWMEMPEPYVEGKNE